MTPRTSLDPMVHSAQEIKDDLDARRLKDFTVSRRTLYVFTFDVTDLSEDQRDALAMEVAVQAESSDGHPGVPSPECELHGVTITNWRE